MHARTGTFEVELARLDEVVARIRDRAVPAFGEHPGFLGYQAYVDRERGRLLGISLWETRAALDASGETARGVLRELAGLGATIVGEPQILELAFDGRVNAQQPGDRTRTGS